MVTQLTVFELSICDLQKNEKEKNKTITLDTSAEKCRTDEANSLFSIASRLKKVISKYKQIDMRTIANPIRKSIERNFFYVLFA